MLQVVESVYSTASQTGSNTFQDTGLTGTITPSSTSSKVVVSVYQPMSGSTDTSTGLDVSYNLLRGSTEIAKGAHDITSDSSTNQRKPVTNALQKLDSPNTTSQVTYKVYIKTGGSGTV